MKEAFERKAQRTGRGRASVVIACYKDSDIVERNLAALARQSFRDFEVIIADDGSPEDYLRCWSAGRRDSRIRCSTCGISIRDFARLAF